MTTATQLRKMQEGRARAAMAREREYAAQKTAFLDWLREEASAHARMTACEAAYDPHSDERRLARSTWQRIMRAMPKPPPDHAWG